MRGFILALLFVFVATTQANNCTDGYPDNGPNGRGCSNGGTCYVMADEETVACNCSTATLGYRNDANCEDCSFTGGCTPKTWTDCRSAVGSPCLAAAACGTVTCVDTCADDAGATPDCQGTPQTRTCSGLPVCVVDPPAAWGNWTECPLCGAGNKTRTCSQGTGSACVPGAVETEVCPVVQACRNCSLGWTPTTPCTRKCGPFGFQWRENTINQPATPGAPIQCPTSKYTNMTCNRRMCNKRLETRGFWSWKVCGPSNFSYIVGSLTGQNIDMFLFEEGKNWDSYRKDVSRGYYPRNFGYTYLSAQLRTENGAGSYPLEADKCYYFVVDYTQVGAATQNKDDWNPLVFSYQLLGNPADPLEFSETDAMVMGEWGMGSPGAAFGLSPLFSLVFGLLASLLFLAC